MSVLDTRQVTDEEKAFFEENGYVVIRGFFTPEEIAPVREAYDQLVKDAEEAHDGALRGQMIQCSGIASTWKDWKEKPYLRAIVDAGRQLMGDDIDFWYDQIIMKPSGNSGSTPWHQDAGYWHDPKADPDSPRAKAAKRAVTCWLALSEVGENHGCMQFIPGSHKGGLVDHESAAHKSKINGALELANIDDSKAVKVTMEPGDLSFHHSWTFHYTTGNEADTPRCGLVNHLCPEGGLDKQ